MRRARDAPLATTARTGILDQVTGSWTGFYGDDNARRLCDALLHAFPGAHDHVASVSSVAPPARTDGLRQASGRLIRGELGAAGGAAPDGAVIGVGGFHAMEATGAVGGRKRLVAQLAEGALAVEVVGHAVYAFTFALRTRLAVSPSASRALQYSAHTRSSCPSSRPAPLTLPVAACTAPAAA